MNQDVMDAGKMVSFTCGCSFDKFDWDKIPLDCSATWELISAGFTKGVFQLEKSLGKRWAKKVKPENIEELSDVISLIRPGPLTAEYRFDPDTGKQLSIADTYVAVKSGRIKPEYLHPVFKRIFDKTYSVPIYQEQIMEICKAFAGFTDLESDDTRKAVGKKIPEQMEKVGKKFIKSAMDNGHSKEMSEEVFSWIDKFSGYGFNKSHGVSYAFLGYWSAYAKLHVPLLYFKHMLMNSDSKQDSAEEVKELIHETKLSSFWSENQIKIRRPSIERMNQEFETEGDDTIVFGLGHVKGVGASAVRNLKKMPPVLSEDADTMTFVAWLKTLYALSNKIKKTKKGTIANKTTIEALIKCAALDCYVVNGMTRVQMLKDYRLIYFLTAKEREWVFDNWKDGECLNITIQAMLKTKTPRPHRKDKIKDYIQELRKSLGGNPKRMAIAWEKNLLGISITGNETDLYNNRQVDTSCKDFLRIKNKSHVCIGVVIESIRSFKDKNGNMMAFLRVSDDSYMLDSICVFSRQYAKYAWILEEGKPVIIKGKKDNDSLLVDYINHL